MSWRPRIRWQHWLYPQIGERLAPRARWQGPRVPLALWGYYGVVAWMTPRLLALGAVGVVPTVGLFAMGIENAAIRFGFAVLALLLAAIGAGWLLRPRAVARAVMPGRVACGCAFDAEYWLTNRGRRAAYDVTVESIPYSGMLDLRLHGAQVAVLPAGQSCRVTGRVEARRRGRYRLPPLRWDSDFPLGTWRWGRTDWSERSLTVYPRYTPLASLALPFGARHRLNADGARQLARAAIEFHGCREFRTGDATRHLHPRSSARLGVPVVKEFQAEGRGRTAIVVDTWRLSRLRRWRPDAVVEAVLSVAAAVADFLARNDRNLELLVAGPGLYRFVSAGRFGFFEEVLDILASVEPCDADPLPQLAPVLVEEIRAIQSVVLILGRWDDRRAALVGELTAWNVGLKTVLVHRRERPPPLPGLPADAICLSCGAVRRGEVAVL